MHYSHEIKAHQKRGGGGGGCDKNIWVTQLLISFEFERSVLVSLVLDHIFLDLEFSTIGNKSILKKIDVQITEGPSHLRILKQNDKTKNKHY